MQHTVRSLRVLEWLSWVTNLQPYNGGLWQLHLWGRRLRRVRSVRDKRISHLHVELHPRPVFPATQPTLQS
jgi:hypothetical protein